MLFFKLLKNASTTIFNFQIHHMISHPIRSRMLLPVSSFFGKDVTLKTSGYVRATRAHGNRGWDRRRRETIDPYGCFMTSLWDKHGKTIPSGKLT